MVFTNKGCTEIIDWLASGAAGATAPLTVGWGSDNTVPTKSDTVLVNEVTRQTFDSTTTNNKEVTFEQILLSTEANGLTLQEVGLFNTDESTVDACEATTGWTASGTNSVTQNTTTFVEGSASLNMVKSDGSSATISVSKTTTSVNFTSATFSIQVYVTTSTYNDLATTDCLTLRFGSDASNYYVYTKDKADFTADTWNTFSFTSATADSTTGSPVLTACDYTYAAILTDNAADTITATNLMLDDIRVFAGDLFARSIFSSIAKTLSIEVQAEITVRVDNVK